MNKNREETWARKLALLMTPNEFHEFAEFLESCDDVAFYSEIGTIDANNFPDSYYGGAEESESVDE